MRELWWLIPGLPLAGAAALALVGGRLSRRAVAVVGVSSVGLSAALALAVAVRFVAAAGAPEPWRLTTGVWFHLGALAPTFGLYLDPLALVMAVVVCVVGFLVHLYSVEHMAGQEGYRRFFACLNLFVGFMLVLVMADNLLLLYLGWEGVGLCSYLLIGFWWSDPANGRAAMKAFVVTRIGDAALALGLCLLYLNLGSLDIQEVLRRAAEVWPVGSGVAAVACLLLVGGAVGKSAQLPLQTWLPDAMAGPSPVSALIHAATMVTAGVYLLARTHALLALAPAVMTVVAVVGAATMLLGATSALAQLDLKRALAYSTMSQIGYMFLALGVGAWTAAIFHFVTHACFKCLLFLASGVVISSLGGQHDIFEMGGLRRRMPVVWATFLLAACSLAALPLLTAGYYSKEAILSAVCASPQGGHVLWAAGLVGALLTALYAFRLLLVVFEGPPREEELASPGAAVVVPLVVLAALSLASGFLPVMRFLAGAGARAGMEALPGGLKVAAGGAALLGVIIAALLYGRPRALRQAGATRAVVEPLRRLLLAGWGFDAVYGAVFVRPFLWLARVGKDDIVDLPYRDLARVTLQVGRGLSALQCGRLRWYAGGIAVGVAVLVAAVILR